MLAAGLVAAGALLAACSSSSSSTTTTTAPPGGKLSSSNAAYIAADLKAPAGSLTAAGSTFVQPFFTKAFYTYTTSIRDCRSTTRAWAAAPGSPTSSRASVDFAASDVPMSASDLAKVPASAGPVIQIPDILGGVVVVLQRPGRDQAAPPRRHHPGRHLRRLHQDVERLPDHRPQPRGLPAVPRHHPRGAGGQLGYDLHLHRLPVRGGPVGVDAGHQQDHLLALVGHPDAEELRGGRRASSPLPYSIGYVELAYALQNNFTFAAIKNAAGLYVVPSPPRWRPTPTRSSASPPTDFSIVNGPGPASYPDRRLQLGHPAAEAEERHHRGPAWSRSSTGPPIPAAARTRPPGSATCRSARPSEPEPDPAPHGDRTHRQGPADQVTSPRRRPADDQGLNPPGPPPVTPLPGGASAAALRAAQPRYRALLVAAAAIFVGLVVWFLVPSSSRPGRPSPRSASRGSSRSLGAQPAPVRPPPLHPRHHRDHRHRPGAGRAHRAGHRAIALAHLVPDRFRAGLSTAVELLAAVPSVVYGLWGLIVLAPLCRSTSSPS